MISTQTENMLALSEFRFIGADYFLSTLLCDRLICKRPVGNFRILKLAQRFVKIFFLVSFPTSLENDLPTFTLRISQCKYFSVESIDGDRCLWLRFPLKSESRMKFC